tara:strand:+ start:1125 stop:1985 length:861 start_codon:yes stop_codon:yes gene_type:complete
MYINPYDKENITQKMKLCKILNKIIKDIDDSYDSDLYKQILYKYNITGTKVIKLFKFCKKIYKKFYKLLTKLDEDPNYKINVTSTDPNYNININQKIKLIDYLNIETSSNNISKYKGVYSTDKNNKSNNRIIDKCYLVDNNLTRYVFDYPFEAALFRTQNINLFKSNKRKLENNFNQESHNSKKRKLENNFNQESHNSKKYKSEETAENKYKSEENTDNSNSEENTDKSNLYEDEDEDEDKYNSYEDKYNSEDYKYKFKQHIYNITNNIRIGTYIADITYAHFNGM